MLKRRIACLLVFIILCMPLYAETIPVRDLADKIGADVSYVKSEEAEYVEFTTGNITLILDLKNKILKDTLGKAVDGATVYREGGTVYVESDEIMKAVSNAKTVKAIREYLDNLSKYITQVFYETSNYFEYVASATLKNVPDTNVASTSDSSQSSNSSDSNNLNSNDTSNTVPVSPTTSSNIATTTTATYEIIDIHVKDVWVVPAKKTADGTLVAEGKITTSSTYGSKRYQWVSCGVRSNKNSFKKYTFEVNPESHSAAFVFGYKLEEGKTSVMGYLYPIYSPGNIMYVKVEETGKTYEIPYQSSKENDILYYGNEECRELSNERLIDWVKKGVNIWTYA